MSAGTQIYTIRIPADLYHHAMITIARRNTWSREEPWSFSDFLRAAIVEKIDKMKRSRRREKRRQG